VTATSVWGPSPTYDATSPKFSITAAAQHHPLQNRRRTSRSTNAYSTENSCNLPQKGINAGFETSSRVVSLNLVGERYEMSRLKTILETALFGSSSLTQLSSSLLLPHHMHLFRNIAQRSRMFCFGLISQISDQSSNLILDILVIWKTPFRRRHSQVGREAYVTPFQLTATVIYCKAVPYVSDNSTLVLP
jgi:hypothetical protein